MTPSELKCNIENAGNDSRFFTRRTMQFFGDTMANYGVRDAGAIETESGEILEAWELYRKQPVKHGLKSSAYFNKANFRRVFKKDEA